MTKVLVLVADRDDPKHTEITVLDDTAEAARLFETLLEAGVEREQIRIFSGTELHADVTHRLSVALEDDNQQVPPAEEAAEREEAAGKDGTGAEAEASQLEDDDQQVPPAEEAAEREEAAGKDGTGAEAEASQDSPRSWFRSRPQADAAD